MINRIITGQGAGEYEMRNAINELLLLSVDAPHGSDREKVIRTHITEALEALDQSSYREQNRALLRELDLLYAYLNQGGLCEGRR
ncbi:hypothetical protein HYW32_01070 [Candidatus Berkelbacteria bacterium]|nr:hypothetical protein [Candidatus Berkelbacteria bacterium]